MGRIAGKNLSCFCPFHTTEKTGPVGRSCLCTGGKPRVAGKKKGGYLYEKVYLVKP